MIDKPVANCSMKIGEFIRLRKKNEICKHAMYNQLRYDFYVNEAHMGFVTVAKNMPSNLSVDSVHKIMFSYSHTLADIAQRCGGINQIQKTTHLG